MQNENVIYRMYGTKVYSEELRYRFLSQIDPVLIFSMLFISFMIFWVVS